MTFDFDTEYDRRGTNAVALDGARPYLLRAHENLEMAYPEEELISMWVADMAFAAPPAATEAMVERIRHPIFGYTVLFDDSYYRVFHDWTKRRYGWSFKPEELCLSPGVVPALYELVPLTCAADDKVLTLTPAYGYFQRAVTHNGRELVTSGLVERNGRYQVDIEDFRAKAADPKTTLFFLCHPHNPTGRAWSDAELREMAVICFENDVVIVSDEIHCDLLRSGMAHTPLAKLYPESNRVVTCMAPSKTFNLAGLQVANIVIPDPDLRAAWAERNHPVVNPVSIAAASGVYRNGDDWLKELKSYLDANFAELQKHLRDHLPKARFCVPDATYLAWIDVGAYVPAEVSLTRFFAERAGVLLEGGEMFVADAGQCIRLNLACPRAVLRRALERIVEALPGFEDE